MDINSKLYIRINSTKEDVKRIIGEPSKIDGAMWTYNSSHIKFDANDRVIEWKNVFDQLSVGMVPYFPSSHYFVLGSSMDDVMLALGAPTAIEASHEPIWSYRASHVKFDSNNKVIEWKSQFEQLKNGFKLPEDGAPYVRIGSSKDDVLSALGSPTTILSINPVMWRYNASHVIFDEHDQVVEWKNQYGQIDYGMKKPEETNDYLKLGLNQEEVLKIMGSPTTVLLTNPNVWKYNASHVMFQDDVVVEWKSMFGQLKYAMNQPSYDGYVKVGSTKEEVCYILGSPTSVLFIKPELWQYDASHVKFKNGLVVEWRNMLHQLDKGFVQGHDQFDDLFIGCDEETVLNRLGSPTCVLDKEPGIWHYGNAVVKFNSNKEVVSWKNIDDIKRNVDQIVRRPY